MQGTSGSDASPKLGLLPLLRSAGRILAWWLLAETLVHLMYMHAIQNNETYLQILPPWALGESLLESHYAFLIATVYFLDVLKIPSRWYNVRPLEGFQLEAFDHAEFPSQCNPESGFHLVLQSFQTRFLSLLYCTRLGFL